MADLKLLLRKLIVTPVVGPKVLFVEIEISHPQSNQTITFQIPGICVAALLPHLQALQQEYPELCGSAGKVVGEVNWSGTVDPEKARYN